MGSTHAATAPQGVGMAHFPQMQKTFEPPLVANENAFLGDIVTSQVNNPDKPMTCGLFRLTKGTPLEYAYKYDEMKVILEGEFIITDNATGKKVRAVPGDVMYFPNGSNITFESEEGGLAFYTGQRKEGTA